MNKKYGQILELIVIFLIRIFLTQKYFMDNIHCNETRIKIGWK